MYKTLHDFYVSRVWRELCHLLKIQRGYRCERCHKNIIDLSYLLGHHKIELTIENVNDPSISLNPDKIEIICQDCHNDEHRRFGYSKHVFIVWGSPYSGRHTAVRQMMRTGDIILDIDALWRAITMGDDKPNGCRFNVFKLRDSLLDQIKTRYGQWCDAYIIATYACPYDLERDVQAMGAEAIYCESTREECMRRAMEAGKTTEYISKWWDERERHTPPSVTI